MCLGRAKSARCRAPLSPWKRFIAEPIRPKLSRDVIKSAKVNLNRYWSKFEELAAAKLPLTTSSSPAMSTSIFNDNDINENILNELKEIGK